MKCGTGGKKEGNICSYINKFLKVEMEAAGWPSKCDIDDKKKDFIRKVGNKEDIDLHSNMVENNFGRKAIAKLNSFWGKFGRRGHITRTKFIREPKKFYDMCRSEAAEVHDIYAVFLECTMVTSTPRGITTKATMEAILQLRLSPLHTPN